MSPVDTHPDDASDAAQKPSRRRFLQSAAAAAAVTTVEGLAPNGDTLAPIQRAFIEKDAFQCGYYTLGQLCSATALIDEYRRGDAARSPPMCAFARRNCPTTKSASA